MATKPISMDAEAYKRLQRLKKPTESFSEVIKRVVPRPIDLNEWFARLERRPR